MICFKRLQSDRPHKRLNEMPLVDRSEIPTCPGQNDKLTGDPFSRLDCSTYYLLSKGDGLLEEETQH